MSFDLPSLFETFEKMRVLVIGDTIIDAREEVVNSRSSVEDGTPVYRKAAPDSVVFSEGGAALVVRNLEELGAHVEFITDAAMPTIKRRYWCKGKKVFHVDVDGQAVKTEAEIASRFNELSPICDAVVVADYRHGLITESLAKTFSAEHDPKRPVYISSQVAQSPSNHHWYGSAPIFVGNLAEHEYFHEFCRHAVVTLGHNGAMRWGLGNKDLWTFPGIKVDAVDACGAGDAFLAAYALTQDIEFANTWAGLSCTVPGPNPPTRDMLKDWCAGNAS